MQWPHVFSSQLLLVPVQAGHEKDTNLPPIMGTQSVSMGSCICLIKEHKHKIVLFAATVASRDTAVTISARHVPLAPLCAQLLASKYIIHVRTSESRPYKNELNFKYICHVITPSLHIQENALLTWIFSYIGAQARRRFHTHTYTNMVDLPTYQCIFPSIHSLPSYIIQ